MCFYSLFENVSGEWVQNMGRESVPQNGAPVTVVGASWGLVDDQRFMLVVCLGEISSIRYEGAR